MTATQIRPDVSSHPADGAGGRAVELAHLIEAATGTALPFRLQAWDGSTAGPDAGPTIVVR